MRLLLIKPPKALKLNSQNVAEGVGFEPTEAFTSTVFKTVAFGRSATPPRFTILPDVLLDDLQPMGALGAWCHLCAKSRYPLVSCFPACQGLSSALRRPVATRRIRAKEFHVACLHMQV